MANSSSICYHSAAGRRLQSDPLWFEVAVPPGTAVAVCLELECGREIVPYSALLQIDHPIEAEAAVCAGFIRSHDPAVGWYRYLDTRPGRASLCVDLPATDWSGLLRIGVRTRRQNAEVRLKSFLASPVFPVPDLVVRHASVRNVDRYHSTSWASLTDFLAASSLVAGMHTVAVNGLLLDFHLTIRPDAPLLCHLHGNTPRDERFCLPRFSGWRITEDLNASRLVISDPALLMSPHIQLAWHAGTSDVPLQYVYELILRKIVKHVRPTRLIFWGGSGGGFASLYLSACFPGSTAFVWNPQTCILAYEPTAVSMYGQTCFGAEDMAQLRRALQDRVVSNLSEVYGEARNTVVYLQNAGDWHVGKHLAPFLAQLGIRMPAVPWTGWLTENLYLCLDQFSEGHDPPPVEMIQSILRILCADEASSCLFAPDPAPRPRSGQVLIAS